MMAVAAERGIEFTVCPFRDGSQARRLTNDHVHVWTLALDDRALREPVHELLSADERERWLRFRFEKHRAQFALTRATLRRLLASYLSVSPREISFCYSSHGKPGLKESALDFNVAHTEGMAVFAFTRGRRIGVDIERIRADFWVDEVAERFFSHVERAALRDLPLDKRHAAFFRIWTRKEAYVKARGEGLSHPLDQFDVSLNDDAQLAATRQDASEAQRWRLENLIVGPEFAAAVAVEVTPPPSTQSDQDQRIA